MTKPATSFSFHHPIILSQPISKLFSDGKESKCFKYKMNKDHKSDFHWTKLFNPEFYITMEVGGVPIGIYMVLFIVFAETGLFAGFFLPGDSLLFLSGIYTRELVETFFLIPSDLSNVTILSLLIATAATLGNVFGYWFGSRSGQFLYAKQDSFFFQKITNSIFL